MTEPTPASLADRVSEGEIRFHELEAHADANTAAAARRRLVSETADADVDALGEYAFDAADAHGSNIENMVGRGAGADGRRRPRRGRRRRALGRALPPDGDHGGARSSHPSTAAALSSTTPAGRPRA